MLLSPCLGQVVELTVCHDRPVRLITGYDGVCALDVFVAAQTLATSHPKEFNELCYSAQLNKAIV
jgi:hypothetical protein